MGKDLLDTRGLDRGVGLSGIVIASGIDTGELLTSAGSECPDLQDIFSGLMPKTRGVLEAVLIPLKHGRQPTVFGRDGWALLTQRIQANLRPWQTPQLAADLNPLWDEEAARSGKFPTLADAATYLPLALRELASEQGGRCFIWRFVMDGIPTVVLIKFRASIPPTEAEVEAAAVFAILATAAY